MSEADGKSHAETESKSIRWRHALLLTFVGSCSIGVVELLSIVTQIHDFGSHAKGDSVTIAPIEYLAAFGMIAGTHVLLWIPLCLGWTLFLSVARRIVPVLSKVPVAGLHVAAFTMLVGVPVAVTNLETMGAGGLGGKAARILIVVVLGGVAVLAARGVGYLHRRGWFGYYQRVLSLAAVVLGALLALGLFAYPRTAFRPASFADANINVDAWQPEANAAAGDSPQNVLFIVMDTVRADHLSVYGYDKRTTPFLEELAKEATLYEQAISPSNWTVPSHASMFTGLLRRTHGTDWGHTWLDDRFTTLAEHAQERGYQTACFANNPWVSRSSNLTQGFDVVEAPGALTSLRHSSARQLLVSHVVPRWPGILNILPWLENGGGGVHSNRRVIAWFDEEVRRKEPFFLFVNYLEAHFPYEPPYAYRKKFLSDDELARSYSHEQTPQSTLYWPMFLSEPHPPAKLQMLRNLYDASLLQLDDRVRELIAILSQRGLLEKTMVVVVADHGEHWGEHGQYSHDFSVYQPLINVPLMVRVPGAQPKIVSTPTSTLEVYGWLLDALGPKGSKPPQPLHEVPVMKKYCLSELVDPNVRMLRGRFQNRAYVDLTKWVRSFYAVQGPRWKLITASDGTHELYDLEVDAEERNDLSDQRPDKVQELTAWMNEVLDQTPRYTPVQAKGAEPAFSPAELRRLRSLGLRRVIHLMARCWLLSTAN